jgi:flagellar protein FliJ
MFTFELESALNYRKTLEEKKLVEFCEVKKQLEKAKDLLTGIQTEKFTIIEQLKNMQKQPFSAPEIVLYLSYIRLFKEKESLQQEIVEKIIQDVEMQREALIEAVKNRKIMDNLKDRQFREFNENLAAYERKIEDETAIISFIRNNK